MSPSSQENLPAEIDLALAHAQPTYRQSLRIFFELDLRLGRIVAGTNEVMLGQMRLAWWRETLAKPIAERPNGDVVLDAIGVHWAGREADLIKLVDGWERLLAEPPLGKEDALAFLMARRDVLMAAYGKYASGDNKQKSYAKPAWWWVCADLAANVSDKEERAMFVDLGLRFDPIMDRLRKPDKGLHLLGALAHRALKRGGRPLMEGRGASLAALRATIF